VCVCVCVSPPLQAEDSRNQLAGERQHTVSTLFYSADEWLGPVRLMRLFVYFYFLGVPFLFLTHLSLFSSRSLFVRFSLLSVCSLRSPSHPLSSSLRPSSFRCLHLPLIPRLHSPHLSCLYASAPLILALASHPAHSARITTTLYTTQHTA